MPLFWAREKTLPEILDNNGRADLRFGLDAAGEISVLTKRGTRGLARFPRKALLQRRQPVERGLG